MNHQWKTSSLQEVVKYNKYLLLSVVVLSVLSLILALSLVDKEEKWVLIPSDNIENKMEVSNTKLYPSYLKPWARSIARAMFTTSPEEVEEQHAEIRKISSSNKELLKFFAEQLAFIKSNNASSVFYVKEAKLAKDGVIIKGTLHYWFAGSEKKVALEKSYLISYRETSRGLILLNNIEDCNKLDAQDK
ncbi:MAG: TraE/TraK family type IV conjugative transfer system protein [Rickettsiaceae bacterium]|nr:TraE/TraK family type IV conjugative transfer system protein [Rickettsiaceae bacterium]